MSNDTWIGLTLKHNMKIPSPPGLRRCELREELFVLGTKGVLLGWLSRVFHFPNPSLLIGQSLGKESALQDRIRFSWRRLPPYVARIGACSRPNMPEFTDIRSWREY